MTNFDAVVLSGGGIKGILELGVLHYYYEKGDYTLDNVQEYAGTSIGAAIALLLICGYTPMEIFSEIYMDSAFNIGECYNIWDITKHMGLMNIDGFIDKLTKLVKKKLKCVPTLKKLEELTGKTLAVAAANITKMCEEKYSPGTCPNLGCVNAVKISCNLPPLFPPIKYNDSYCVDGGLVNNFPWDYISNCRKRILGIIVAGSDFSLPANALMGYFYRCMTISINQLTELRCQMAPEKVELVKVSWSGNSSLLQFTMPPSDQKMEMFLIGYKEAEKKKTTKFLYVDGWTWNVSGKDTSSYVRLS